MKHRSTDKLLVILTAGELVWDSKAGDFDRHRSTAVPPNLRMPHEPGWVDLRWAQSGEKLSLRNAQFREKVLDVAAVILSRPKDDLDSEDIRRFNMKVLVGVIVVVLLTLSIAATVAAINANHQKIEAQHNARVADSRRVATTSLSYTDTGLDLASLLALEAFRIEDTYEARMPFFRISRRIPESPDSSIVKGACGVLI